MTTWSGRLSRGLHQHPHGPKGTSGKSIHSPPLSKTLIAILTRKEAFYGKPILLADRDMAESDSDAILHDADKQDIAFLVAGDPFGYLSFLSLWRFWTREIARRPTSTSFSAPTISQSVSSTTPPS